MEVKAFSALVVIGLSSFVLFVYVDATRHRPIKASTSKSGSSRNDGSTSLKLSYLRIYSRPPKSVTVRENKDETIECRAGGSPPPVIHWLKDGQMIPETAWDAMTLENVENSDWDRGVTPKLGISSTKSRLYLSCASLETSGEYTCVAENPYQRISSNTEVNVEPSARQTSRDLCAEKKKSGKIPRILMWSDQRLEYMNGSARLFCRASGFPKPTVRWLETEGQPVTQDPNKYQVLPSGDLVIRNLEWSDMGVYLCIAWNIHGSDRTETFLYPTALEKN